MGVNSTLTTSYVSTNQIMNEKWHSESLWVNNLIQNPKIDEVFVQAQIGRNKYNELDALTNQICIIEIQSRPTVIPTMDESMINYFCRIIRSIFEQFSLQTYITFSNNHFIVLSFNLFSSKRQKDHLLLRKKLPLISDQITNILDKYIRKEFHLYMGVSTTNRGFESIYSSYKEAAKAIFLKFFYQSPIIFYDNLGAFQILLHLHEKGMLESYVMNHIGPLIEEDQKKNSDLLRTLKVFLEHNGSKQSAADELHIVRQSLYYRLKKIKELLGDDYMSTQKRLALQLAIQAYELLNYEVS